MFEESIGKKVTIVVSEGKYADATTGTLTAVNDNVLELTTQDGRKHYFNTNTFLKLKLKEEGERK
ncbi:MAG: hypothetical protein L6408_00700 [Nanoarchaeota archaeon]|nr:hypothetical protein [Nanoarchaeota archaeon]